MTTVDSGTCILQFLCIEKKKKKGRKGMEEGKILFFNSLNIALPFLLKMCFRAVFTINKHLRSLTHCIFMHSIFLYFFKWEKMAHSPWSHLPRSLNPENQDVLLSSGLKALLFQSQLLSHDFSLKKLQNSQALSFYHIIIYYSSPFLVFFSN